jgi:hypothetical protein
VQWTGAHGRVLYLSGLAALPAGRGPGARIDLGSEVQAIEVSSGRVAGVRTAPWELVDQRPPGSASGQDPAITGPPLVSGLEELAALPSV